MWISELESAMLGTIAIGFYASKNEAYEATDKWLRETTVSSGKKKKTMLELVNEDFSCDVCIYEEDGFFPFPWEDDDDW